MEKSSELVPVYLRNHILRYMPSEFLRRFSDHFEIVENRRGHIKRAMYKQAMSFDDRPNSTIGNAFEQHLNSGRCYALQGVLGSE